MRQDIDTRPRRARGTLLAAALIALFTAAPGLAAAAPADPGGTCDGCTFKYTYDDATCTFKMTVSCTGKRCIQDPNFFVGDSCKRKYTETLTDVTATLLADDVTVERCKREGNEDVCDPSRTTTCQLTYWDWWPKPPTEDDPVSGETTIEDDDGTATVSWEVLWSGSQIALTLTNESTRSFRATWSGTPFTDVFLAPGDAVTEVISTEGPPTANRRLLELEDLDFGGTVIVPTVAYLGTAEEAPDEAPVPLVH